MIRRILRLVHEHGGDAVIVGIIIVVFLLVDTARHPGSGIGLSLVSSKENIDLAGKLLTITLGGVGAIATYRRFFKGRVMQPRLRLRLSGRPILWSVIPTDAARIRCLLHSVDLEIENVGTAIVWEPDVLFQVRAMDADEAVNIGMERDGIERPVSRGSLSGVGPGEIVVYQYRFHVPTGVTAFRTTVEISSGRHVWHRACVLANRIAPSDKIDA